MDRIPLRSAPELKRVVLAAFPSYRKRDAYLSVFTGKQNINSYWDGGSRDEYAIVELQSLQRKGLPTSSHPYFDIAARGLANASSPDVETDHVGNLYLKHLPEGFALVRAGTFCGKAATAHVYLNPANMAKLLGQ